MSWRGGMKGRGKERGEREGGKRGGEITYNSRIQMTTC